MPVVCRDCLSSTSFDMDALVCSQCSSGNLIAHRELFDLMIAHVDCDAFFASVEKRDNPFLATQPVIIGGGKRGVVATACYVARQYGIHSAMPMYKALSLCPHAVVLPPNRQKYKDAARHIRAHFCELTPMVESISIDEAFLDLSGTALLHHRPPAVSLARLALRIKKEVGITLSIGLSHNKFLAKIASDLNKPSGFSVIGKDETLSFLEPLSVSKIWGVGKSLEKKLQQERILTIGDLRKYTRDFLSARYGKIGHRLYDFSRGLDPRSVDTQTTRKSISAETTFDKNIKDKAFLLKELWPLCEKVSYALRQKKLQGVRITVKMKRADFKTITRSKTLPGPTDIGEVIYRVAGEMVRKEAGDTFWRLIGVGVEGFEQSLSFFDLHSQGEIEKLRKIEIALDGLRDKFGRQSIYKGRSLHVKK